MGEVKIAVIGLGYVGLPLAVEFGKKYKVIGFDIDKTRIAKLKKNIDETLEVSEKEINESKHLSFTSDESFLSASNVYIVTVPTPIDGNNDPDLSPIKRASELVGKYINEKDLVIYESTVYPGATEEVCVPILEKISKLKFNIDFFVGYSPERINPGDKTHRLADIVKVTSGSNAEIANKVDMIYSSIIKAGTYKAESIKVAEAAKVIENTQRDVNIALMNELSIIFNKLGIDSEDVLNAAGTKWNFMNFRPGLVGGHCIGVDPYYLTHKSKLIGYSPKMILAGRKLNDGMARYVVSQLVQKMEKREINPIKSNILILGFAFKENCPDFRNTKVIDVINELKAYQMNISVLDPWCSPEAVKKEHNIDLISEPSKNEYDAIILAVAHSEFKTMHDLKPYLKKKSVIYDLKHALNKNQSDLRL